MGWLLAEAMLAAAILVGIMWWTWPKTRADDTSVKMTIKEDDADK